MSAGRLSLLSAAGRNDSHDLGKTIRVDEDTIDYFKSLAEKNGLSYQNLINLYLRECAESEKPLR
jgi:predicted DNA binding CopG/RHH family protein